MKAKSILFYVVITLVILGFIIGYTYKKQNDKAEVKEVVFEELVVKDFKDEKIKPLEKKAEEKIKKLVKKQVSLGEFKLTAYCACSTCCGQWAGSPTASGTTPRANHTIAVDTSVIPFGTEVVINGETYVAEDTGSAINGYKIDVYMTSHEAALKFGVQYAEVFVEKWVLEEDDNDGE